MAELEAESSPALRKIKGRDGLRRLLSDCRKRGDTVAFTNGVFDLLHLGHVELIRFASRQADILVVGVNSDESTRKGKGEGRPIVPEDVRARTLASFPNVDYVVIFEEKSVLPLVKEVRPDVIVKGGDYGKKGVVGWEFVESYGGQVMVSPEVEGLSTTEIIRRIGNDKRH
jgi:D-beta-D-heptose 7-phosphate kinase/D-beta-D-heptose 1-phosphate adenosyltransferase